METVSVDSDEMARALDFARKFFQQTTLEDSLGWNDASNNKAFLSEQISSTNNAESILWVAQHDFPDIGKVTGQALNPKGPTGERFHILLPWSHSVFTVATDIEAAKAFLRWLMRRRTPKDGTLGPTATMRPTFIPTTTLHSGTSSRATCPVVSCWRRRTSPSGRRRCQHQRGDQDRGGPGQADLRSGLRPGVPWRCAWKRSQRRQAGRCGGRAAGSGKARGSQLTDAGLAGALPPRLRRISLRDCPAMEHDGDRRDRTSPVARSALKSTADTVRHYAAALSLDTPGTRP